MMSRVSGMLRDIAMASAFGTQGAVAAFLVAFRFSHLLRRLFGEGAMQTAFIPHFEGLRNESPQRACSFFRDLIAALSVGLIALIFLTMLLLGSVLLFADLSPGNQEIVFLTFLMMPSLLFICLFGLNASLLQCEKGFFITGAAPVIFNVVWIIGVWFLWQAIALPAPDAMPWLAGVVIVACLCQWLVTVPSTLAILKQSQVALSWHHVRLISQDLKSLGKPLLLGLVGVAASQINNALDAVFARYTNAEGPALLWYALRLQQLPLALFGIAIAGALLPPLARALKGNDLTTYRLFLEFALRRSIALMLPITAALFVLGDSCVNLIYGRGDFTHFSTIGTTQCLWGYSLGLIPMTLVLILAPAFYAQSNYRIPTVASVVAMLLNVTLNFIMIFVLGLGSASVALATSISAWVNCILLGGILQIHLGVLGFRSLGMSFAKVLFATCLACLVVVAVDTIFLQGSNLLLIGQGLTPSFPRAFSEQLMRFVVQSICFSLTLFAAAKLVRADDLLDLITTAFFREAKKKVVV